MVHRPTKLMDSGGLDLISQIQAAENAAHKIGAHVTAHALSRARNTLGCEIAGDVVMAGQHLRGMSGYRPRSVLTYRSGAGDFVGIIRSFRSSH